MVDISLIALRLIYVVLFFVAVFIGLKFQWGQEGKDERGKQIANTSYGIVFPLLPLGWFLIELFDQFIRSFSFEEYRSAIWFLITGLFILHSAFLLLLKRKY